ncbi:exodeoxyribonuclease VII large subunit [Methylobacterium sp. Leaf104]|uniref:exodeoxyribonuclease VII large subunit n=1 Tax=Methylobacterium TaxID=407 RepID=UPI0006F50438|nr:MULTISPECIES: exodeoxyribonuclease VII large subunit [Methylobacterium]KQP29566.1 exodeoxyribonuclease VII large subunit [Methylobacterium sp. Leaf104]MCI9881891.1 exodeoxyribonuclease VII large subunit [Methylobacterium goesingense]
MAVPPPPAKAAPPSGLVSNVPEWSVGDLASALKRTLEDAFGHVRLRGEISGFRGQHGSGHAYFSLKDGSARIDAVVWKGTFNRLRQRPQEGLEVVATGRITTFPGKSSYQIVIETLEPAGIGAWMALLEERKRVLAAEGLFAAERKRPIPFLPRVVGVVTSPTGAVIRDILHRLADRFARPALVWPVRVQGEGAAEEIAAAIRGFNALAATGPIPRPDVLIVARGGGSIEDLWAFNEECVVRAAADSTIPLISAVGHETDTTLIDFVSDRRAPTPTGAAEMAVPVRADLVPEVVELGRRQREAVQRRLDRERSDLRALMRAMPDVDAFLAAKRQRLDLAEARLGPALAGNARVFRLRVSRLVERFARHPPALALAQARGRVARLGGRPEAALRHDLARKGEGLSYLGRRLVLAREGTVSRARAEQVRSRDRLGALQARLVRAGARLTERRADRLAGLAGLLGSLSYRAVLARGYALVRDADGRAVRTAAQAAPRMTLEFADGVVGVQTRDLPWDPRADAVPAPPQETGAGVDQAEPAPGQVRARKTAPRTTAPKKAAPKVAQADAAPIPARQGTLFDL